MKISQIAKSLLTVMILPVCGTALTAAAVQLETTLNQELPLEGAATEAVQEADTVETTAAPQEDESEATVKVNDAVAGWNGADPDAELNLGAELRSSWVMLNSEGNLPGSVSTTGQVLPEAKVFLIQNGKLVSESVTNSQGQFMARGVQAGSYSVLVHGGGHYAISGLIVLENDNSAANIERNLSLTVSESSTLAIYNLITSRATSVTFRNFGIHAFGETADDPARLYGLAGLASQKPEAVPSSTIKNYRVSISDDGSFVGRLHAITSLSARPVDMKSADVVILKDGQVIHNTQTNRYGVFSISGLEPGDYSLVAASPDGVLVAGFQLVDTKTDLSVTQTNDSTQHFVTTRQESVEEVAEEAIDVPAPEMPAPADVAPAPSVDPVVSFDGCLAPREDIGWINHYMLQNRVFDDSVVEDVVMNDAMGACPMVGDGCCGAGGYGGYGGGGGFGGLGLGGGLGGRMALPLTAAAIAAIASKDNDNYYRAPAPASAF